MSLARGRKGEKRERVKQLNAYLPSPLELSKWIHFTHERQYCNRRILNGFYWVSLYSDKHLRKFTDLPALCPHHSIPGAVTASHRILPSGLVGQNDVLSSWHQGSNPMTASKLSPPHSDIVGYKCCDRGVGFSTLGLYERAWLDGQPVQLPAQTCLGLFSAADHQKIRLKGNWSQPAHLSA